ncbi:MAG: hypothetical protein JXB14_05975 [Candidatus Altiarchaeota archaeon]|nr:hypothetical protein [Candidatus Altiarchaeota archaeon]
MRNRYVDRLCERALSRAREPCVVKPTNNNSERNYEGEAGEWVKRAEVIERQVKYFKMCGKYTQAGLAEQKLVILQRKIEQLNGSGGACEVEGYSIEDSSP